MQGPMRMQRGVHSAGIAVRPRARPRPLPRRSNHPGPDRIEIRIAQGLGEVLIVERAGEEPVLPEMPAALFRPVERKGIFGMNAAQGAGEGILALGDGHQVNVIRHEAVAEDARAVTGGMAAEQAEVAVSILGT